VLVAASCSLVPARALEPAHVLVFSGTYGFRHGQIPKMVDTVEALAASSGAFTVEHTEDASVFTASLYDRIDAIFFLQVTGSPPLSQNQKDRLLSFIGCGAAFIGVHASADSGDGWPEYTEMLGARFQAHPHQGRDAQGGALVGLISEASFNIEDDTHPATEPWRGRGSFAFDDEIYRYRSDPRNVPGLNVLVSIDANTHYWPLSPVPNPFRYAGQFDPWLGYDDDEPVAWTKTHGNGRVFYTNFGHNPSTWDDADFRAHLLGGIEWATSARADPGCVP
jgi:type 1 glutamine amidotransferase